ncbi:hypothetical protein [Thermococcus celer]|uniref:Uncharacterized protein n=1 Tax=Thermococcus celer Vu 13 = JCM 8558 TaxID=1293037 RepID=A0A218P467_THECE|nr:hypothetical protein [Thermococcus celer]ASI99703.1 hypothetical protein A3L02_09085 [Thermococcus celer Vu 13 = JCM 8558]
MRKPLEELEKGFKELGIVTISATNVLLREAQMDEYGLVNGLLRRAVDTRERLRDALVGVLTGDGIAGGDAPLARLLLVASYDAYRIVRHCSRVEAILMVDGREPVRNTAIEGITTIQPALEAGVSALTGGRAGIQRPPFFESSFEEFWKTNVKTDDPYVMGVLMHCEGAFKLAKHLLGIGLYHPKTARVRIVK